MSAASEVDLAGAVADLAHVEPRVREAAASTLRLGPPHDDHGEAYWTDRVAKVHKGMTRAETETLLPRIGMEGGTAATGSTTEIWRVDAYWTVLVWLAAPDETILGPPELTRKTQSVWVPPPSGFSGRWVTWYLNGEKSHEIAYRDGVYDGVFRSFDDLGERVMEQHYSAGIASGADTGWYRGGAKSYEGQYVAGKRSGTWTHWYADGQLKSREDLDSGVRSGVSSTWFPSGQIQHEAQYLDGQKHGLDRAWDEAGKQLWSREYVRGERVP